jgi:glycosyltransferase involved in cell wall biosynthesis
MQIKLSVALVTRNRPDSLERTLKSLSAQNIQPYEVIVSDDSNDTDLKQRNIQIVQRYGCIYIEGPQKGLYANRNYVAKKCTGTHIRTMDDDHEFLDNHLHECLKAIESEPETIWTIGEYLPQQNEKLIPSPIAGQLHPRGYSYLPKDMNNYFGISCGGTIYPKSIIDKNLLNCDYYKFGAMYLEYGARLKKAGYTIKPLRSTYIIHRTGQTTANELSKQIITEARLFSMLCLSFVHYPTYSNKMKTIFQIMLGLLTRKYVFKIVCNALKNFQRVISKSSFDNEQ